MRYRMTLIEWFTPAYAGKISRTSDPQPTAWVHPRIRGEDFSRPRKALLRTGSPPHTRGRSVYKQLRRDLTGFTPAYAGKMQRSRLYLYAARVHPRIRGEDSVRPLSTPTGAGSPPHTRGRFRAGAIYTPGRRFTPAYAGKIMSNFLSPTPKRVHPRIRGEDLVWLLTVTSLRGSPPHTRGRWRCNT